MAVPETLLEGAKLKLYIVASGGFQVVRIEHGKA